MRALPKAFLICILLSGQGYAKEDVSLYPDSKYVPMCFETKPRCGADKKNLVLIMSSAGSIPSFSGGYFRVVKPDLAFGLMLDGNTATGVIGWKFGFGYLFGD